MLVNFLINRIGWKSLALGAGAAMYGGAIARPVLDSVVRAGMGLKDATVDAYTRVKAEAFEAQPGQSHSGQQSVADAVESLRNDVKSLRAEVAAVREHT